MGSLIALLPAAFNLLKVLAPIVAIGIGLMAAWHSAGELATKRAEAQQATEVAQANAATVSRLQAQQEAADRQVAAMVKIAEERTMRYNSLRRKVLNAANTSACAASAPLRTVLDGLRGEQTAVSQDGASHH